MGNLHAKSMSTDEENRSDSMDPEAAQGIITEGIHGQAKNGEAAVASDANANVDAVQTELPVPEVVAANDEPTGAAAHLDNEGIATSKIPNSSSGSFFSTMAQSYIDNQVYKQPDSEALWDLAVKKFYDDQGTDEADRKRSDQIKGFFLTGLESRIRSLPRDPGDDSTREDKVCRQIKYLLNMDDGNITNILGVTAAAGQKKSQASKDLLNVVDDNYTNILEVTAVGPAKKSQATTITDPAIDDNAAGRSKKHTRLYFGRDDKLFVIMAKAYIEKEVYQLDTNHQWELAIKQFYDEADTRSGEPLLPRKKSLIELKRPFLNGLESRIKALSQEAQSDEPEHVSLCRRIRDLRELARADRTRKAQEEPEGSRKRSKLASDTVPRGRPRQGDLEWSPAMLARYEAVKADRDKQRKAEDAVEAAERQLAEAHRKLQEAIERQRLAADHARKVSSQFSREVIQEPGPWRDMYLKLANYKNEHGNCNIIRGQTPELKDLRKWVLRQRDRYNKRDDQPSKLPWYLAQNLEELGFVWKYCDGTVRIRV
jgi:Helicase associated domain